MDLGLKGKVAVVTGAGSQIGFGKGIALTLAKEGCDVVVTDIDFEGVEKTAAEIKALGRKCLATKTDVTDSAQVKSMIDSALGQFGKIDILVNNVGTSTQPKDFVDTTEAEWDKNLNINLRSALNCTKAVLPHMIKQKSGKIVSMASTAAFGGQPSGTLYGAAKAGIANFTAGLAREVYDSGITVNCIAPGLGATGFHAASGFTPEFIETRDKMAAAGKTITPQDIGNAIAFLASDAGKHITGQCLRVSGVM